MSRGQLVGSNSWVQAVFAKNALAFPTPGRAPWAPTRVRKTFSTQYYSALVQCKSNSTEHTFSSISALLSGAQRLVQVRGDVEDDEAVGLVALGEDRELRVHVKHEEGEGVEAPGRELVAQLYPWP